MFGSMVKFVVEVLFFVLGIKYVSLFSELHTVISQMSDENFCLICGIITIAVIKFIEFKIT